MSDKIPFAPKNNKLLVQHGHQRLDPYYWMNERDSPAVLANIREENEYAARYFKPFLSLQEEEITSFDLEMNRMARF